MTRTNCPCAENQCRAAILRVIQKMQRAIRQRVVPSLKNRQINRFTWRIWFLDNIIWQPGIEKNKNWWTGRSRLLFTSHHWLFRFYWMPFLRKQTFNVATSNGRHCIVRNMAVIPDAPRRYLVILKQRLWLYKAVAALTDLVARGISRDQMNEIWFSTEGINYLGHVNWPEQQDLPVATTAAVRYLVDRTN